MLILLQSSITWNEVRSKAEKLTLGLTKRMRKSLKFGRRMTGSPKYSETKKKTKKLTKL